MKTWDFSGCVYTITITEKIESPKTLEFSKKLKLLRRTAEVYMLRPRKTNTTHPTKGNISEDDMWL